MLSIFGNKNVQAFGLDISDASIKIMQLRRGEKIRPVAFADYDLPPKIIDNHLIRNEGRLAEHIIYAMDKAGRPDTKYVIASIPEAKSFLRQIRIPKLSQDEIAGAIPWEVEQDIPLPIDQVYLDWQIVGTEGNKQIILVAATPKDYVDALLGALKLARLKPVALELESIATARCLIGPAEKTAAVLILDIASAETNFIIAEDAVLEYTSSIPIAGNAFTESISRNLGISFAEADKLKRDVGLVSERGKGEIRRSILPILDNVVDEIRTVVRFHEEHSGKHKPISKVILCGSSSKLLGIADYIAARLNLGSSRPLGRVELGNPWVNLGVSKLDENLNLGKEQSLGFATAIGLALRGVGEG